MNYQKIYDQIIQKSQSENRKKKQGIYYENHHILPVCMGGLNDKENLVLLTGREHFIAHKLLIKIYPECNKLIFAAWLMYSPFKGRGYLVGAREYEIFRIKHSQLVSEFFSKRKGKLHHLYGKKRSIETCNKIRIASSKHRHTQETKDKLSYMHKTENLSEETRNKMSISQKNKKPISDEVKQKMSLTQKRKGPKTEEHKQKIRNAWVNKDLSSLKRGSDHPNYGKHRSEETREKLRLANTGKRHSQESIDKAALSKTGKHHSEEWSKHISEGKMGVKQKIVKCPFCEKIGGEQTIKRWHFDNCIFNPNRIIVTESGRQVKERA